MDAVWRTTWLSGGFFKMTGSHLCSYDFQVLYIIVLRKREHPQIWLLYSLLIFEQGIETNSRIRQDAKARLKKNSCIFGGLTNGGGLWHVFVSGFAFCTGFSFCCVCGLRVFSGVCYQSINLGSFLGRLLKVFVLTEAQPRGVCDCIDMQKTNDGSGRLL